MKRLLLMIVLIGLIGFPSGAAFAATDETSLQQQGEDYFNLPLCLPGMQSDGTCLLYGPSRTAAEMKAAGFPYPPRELPAAYLPAEYGVMPVLVAKINLADYESAPIYGSFEDAVAEINPISQIAPGHLRFISYIDRKDFGGKPYLQLSSGGWMRAAPAAYSNYRGLLFFDNPRNDFGWIVDETPSYQSPSFDAPLTGNNYVRENLIQVYATVEVDGIHWYEIAPDEWVNSLKARSFSPKYDPPEGVTAQRWIEIDLYQQIMAIYEDGKLRFATLIASGLEPFLSRPGVYPIFEKKPLETMQGAFEADRSDFYYLQDVPWTMYYDGADAIHAAYWRTFFGYPQSHGCINLSPADAEWVYEWANEGDMVWLHDPSGQYPTDPSYYGTGGP